MSIENTPPFGDSFEAADEESLRVLRELAESALGWGEEVREVSYTLESPYGHVVLKTRTRMDDEPLTETSFAVHGVTEEDGMTELLLEYAFAPNGELYDEYVAWNEETNNNLERYGALCTIGDVCRSLLSDHDLSNYEQLVLTYFKQLAGAFTDDERPAKDVTDVIGRAITACVQLRGEEAEHIAVRNFSAHIEGHGTLEVRSFAPIASKEADTYPELEIEFEDVAANRRLVFTAFEIDELSLIEEDCLTGELRNLEDQLRPSLAGVGCLNFHLTGLLAEGFLLDEEAAEGPDDDPLRTLLEQATLYFNLFLHSEEGERNHIEFSNRAFEKLEAFRLMFESRFQLQSVNPNMKAEQYENWQQLVRLNRHNRIKMHLPFTHHYDPETNFYEIVEFDEGDIVDVHYLGCELGEIEDEEGDVIYRGVLAIGFVEIAQSSRAPEVHEAGEHEIFYAAIPLRECEILSESGSFN
jgi:hypothetical protein